MNRFMRRAESHPGPAGPSIAVVLEATTTRHAAGDLRLSGRKAFELGGMRNG